MADKLKKNCRILNDIFIIYIFFLTLLEKINEISETFVRKPKWESGTDFCSKTSREEIARRYVNMGV
jgi:hypothetical protein